MKRFLAAVCLFATTTQAQAYLAQNGLRVEPLAPDAFSVPYRGRSGPRDFWCAAGDYADRVLHLPKATRIYRTSPVPRGSGEGMTFSLDPAQAQAPGLLRLGRNPGLTVAYARFQCELVDRHG